jgi:glycerol-3-phosphate acyltransferase PlsY
MISKTLLFLPIAYLFGSVPWGVIVTRFFANINIREAGSGNIGAHNVYRLTGTKLGLATLIGDLLKGAIPIYIALAWIEPGWQGDVWLSLVALSAFFGHLFSIFLGFKGGKGVATGAGCFLAISPTVFFVCLLVYILILCMSGYSSAGSLSASLVLPIVTWPATHSLSITLTALILTVAIFTRHSDNIGRLAQGKEHPSFRAE